MDTITARIAHVVSESCDGNRSEFARRLGITPGYAAQIYNGVRTPSDRTIADICREFRISREWLEHGTGPMKLPEVDEDLAYINRLLADDDAETVRFIKNFFRAYTALPPTDQKVIDNLIRTLTDQK